MQRTNTFRLILYKKNTNKILIGFVNLKQI